LLRLTEPQEEQPKSRPAITPIQNPKGSKGLAVLLIEASRGEDAEMIQAPITVLVAGQIMGMGMTLEPAATFIPT
jgi:hypothetical protein